MAEESKQNSPVTSGVIATDPVNASSPFLQHGNPPKQQYVEPNREHLKQTHKPKQPVRIADVKIARKLGFSHVTIGTLCLVFGLIYYILGQTYKLPSTYCMTSIWGGIIFQVAGTLTICSSYFPTTYCTKCSALCLNIFCVFVALFGVGVTLIDITTLQQCFDNRRYKFTIVSPDRPRGFSLPPLEVHEFCNNVAALQLIGAISSSLMSLALLTSVFSAVSTGCGCRCCSCCKTDDGHTQQYNYITSSQPYHPSIAYHHRPQPSGYQSAPHQSQNIESPATGSYEPGYTPHYNNMTEMLKLNHDGAINQK